MSLETATNISQLNPANPSGPDRLAQGDDHIRLIKAALRATFPAITGAVTLSHTAINALSASLVPFGLIADWYGSAPDVPQGWAVCNGAIVNRSDNSGTVTLPDLRNKVTAGASADHVAGSSYGQTSKTVTTEAGGAHTPAVELVASGAYTPLVTIEPHSLTLNEMPNHRHGNGVADDNVGNLFPRGTQPGLSGGNVQNANSGTNSTEGLTESVGGGQGHSHSATVSGAPAHTHTTNVSPIPGHAHSVTLDVTQPTMALHKIMKI